MELRRLSQVIVGIVVVSWGAYQVTAGVRGSALAQHELAAGTSSFEAATLAMAGEPNADQQARGQAPGAQQGPRALTSTNSVRLLSKTSGQCRAFAPGDWRIMGVSPHGDAGELVSGDGRSYAGWGVRGVNRAMEPYFGPLYGDPPTSSQYLLGKAAEAIGDRTAFAVVGGGAQFGDGYVAQELRSSASKAVIVYRLYPAAGMFPPGSYVISLRMAIAPLAAGDFALKTAVGVAGSIDCRTAFVPPADNDVPLPRPGDAHDRRRQREADELADYNAELGTQTFHSPSTGENVLVDRDAAWTNGPQGEGVYRRVGNEYEKLTPGRAP